jgi:hypothetical protein
MPTPENANMQTVNIGERYAKRPTQVMILGCGRSGTSIFGELFDGLAGYTYLSEPSFDDVLASDFKRPHAFKVPRESPRYKAAPGLSFPISTFLEKAPDTRFFWMVRHPIGLAILATRAVAEKMRPPLGISKFRRF